MLHHYIGCIYTKAGWRDGRSKGFSTFQLKVYGCQQTFGDQLHRVTDRPHKVNNWLYEVTDGPHQARLGVFGFISLTCQMVVLCLAVHETSQIK